MQALIVEDDPRVAQLVEKLLWPWSMHVRIAPTGLAAMKCLEAADESLVFVYVDIGLPDSSGLDIVQEVRRLRPTASIVVATGRTEPVDLAGVVVLRKPFSVAEFQAVVDACVQTRPAKEKLTTEA